MEIAYKVRHDLIVNLNFIRLTMSLYPPDIGGGLFNPTVFESLKATEEFINGADERQLIDGGPEVLNALEPILQKLLREFPPKKELVDISRSFNMLLSQDKSFLSYGIPYQWLDQHIDTSKGLNPDIPYHARIGTGYHAGRFSLEEMHLMQDAFFFLIRAEKETKLLIDLIPEMNRTKKEGYPDTDLYHKALNVKLNACSYARNSILNFYSFIECFVNSIGYDYFLRNGNLNQNEKEILQGQKNGNYVSLEYKIEKIHQIVRADHKQILSILDSKQLREPFLTFFAECKEIRDSAMHYSPNKKSIWLKPTDWTDKAKIYSQVTINVAKEFWKACYPTKDYPSYLQELDYVDCYETANKRDEDSGETRRNNSR
jgi:hypothetical protein